MPILHSLATWSSPGVRTSCWWRRPPACPPPAAPRSRRRRRRPARRRSTRSRPGRGSAGRSARTRGERRHVASLRAIVRGYPARPCSHARRSRAARAGPSSPAAAATTRTTGGSEAPNAETAASREPARRCKEVAAPERQAGRRREKPTEALDAGTTYDVVLRDELRRLHDPARPEDVAADGRLVRVAGEERLLRRHRLPPDRARLRDPGRRPDRDRHRRAGLLDARRPPPDDASTRRASVAMAKTDAEPPGTAGSQFYVVTAADAGLPPDVRDARQGREGPGRWSTRSASWATRPAGSRDAAAARRDRTSQPADTSLGRVTACAGRPPPPAAAPAPPPPARCARDSGAASPRGRAPGTAPRPRRSAPPAARSRSGPSRSRLGS